MKERCEGEVLQRRRSSPDLRRPIALPSLIAATALLLGVCRSGLGALAALGGDELVRVRVSGSG